MPYQLLIHWFNSALVWNPWPTKRGGVRSTHSAIITSCPSGLVSWWESCIRPFLHSMTRSETLPITFNIRSCLCHQRAHWWWKLCVRSLAESALHKELGPTALLLVTATRGQVDDGNSAWYLFDRQQQKDCAQWPPTGTISSCDCHQRAGFGVKLLNVQMV